MEQIGLDSSLRRALALRTIEAVFQTELGRLRYLILHAICGRPLEGLFPRERLNILGGRHIRTRLFHLRAVGVLQCGYRDQCF